MPKQEYSKLGQMIRGIATNKGITLKEVSERAGFNHANNLRDRLLENYGGMRIDTLMKICEALGVELCIMDGYKKYRLTDKQWDAEVDVLLNRLADESDSTTTDRYMESRENYLAKHREREAKRRESNKEGYNDYMREYMRQQARNKPLIEDGNLCYRCEHYERKLKNNGKGYCPILDRYTAVSAEKGCDFYRESE